MGYDCGFDMVPRLSKLNADKIRWRAFIEAVKETYEDDPVFQVQSHVVEFEVGEHPKLPFEGHKFLSFSSKVSGPTLAAAEPYIREVYHIAREYFSQQVRFWHELHDKDGYYGRNEVNESLRSYHDSVCLSIFLKASWKVLILYYSNSLVISLVISLQVQTFAPQMIRRQ